MNVRIPRLLLTMFLMSWSWTAAARVTVEVVSDGQPVQLHGAVVSFQPMDTERAPRRESHSVSMEQINRQFRPFILPVPVNTPVLFPNLDETAHHVYSFSKIRRFELPLYKGELPDPITFANPGVVPLGCNIHDWMIGYIVVVDSPYFMQIDGDRGTIETIPPGRYEVQVWHPALDGRESLRELVEITANHTKFRFDLEFPLLSVGQPPPPVQRFDERLDY
ncbi:MAG: methylamine utilization protein [Gammaproteobacteria bacterium]|nr:methylamine utilization protein [Gammaproteobacteria bacterium]